MKVVMTDLKDMNDSEKLELIRHKLNNTPVENMYDAIILLDELDKIVEVQ